MDSEEIRKKRRELILKRSGMKIEEKEIEIVKPKEENIENSAKKQLEMMENAEKYKVFIN